MTPEEREAKRKARIRGYGKTAKKRAIDERYRKSPQGKLAAKLREQLPHTRERRKRYRNSLRGREVNRQERQRLKQEALAVYSENGIPKCVCCGENNIGFLTLDHVNNDGKAHKKLLNARTHQHLYRRLKVMGWPKDVPLQVMCWNCNSGRAANGGICPHKQPVRIFIKQGTLDFLDQQ